MALMAIVIVFLLGIANFAMHRAVLESDHPLMGRIASRRTGGWPRWTMLLEFAVLLAALLLVARDQHAWAWAYAIYTAGNACAAWLILSRRL